MVRTCRRSLIVIITIVLICFSCSSRKGPTVKRWILLTLDTLRSDHVGTYGNPRVKTPAIDYLARKSLIFSDAVAESPWTIPSHASLLTSRFPRTHGAIFTHKFLDEQALTAAEILSGDNFLCGAIIGASILSSDRGFRQGFHWFDEDRQKVERTAPEVAKSAMAWLSSNLNRNIFLWAHFYDPHWPYNPPGPYNQMYPPHIPNQFDDLISQKTPDKKKNVGKKGRKKEVAETIDIITDDILDRALSLYDGEISFLDRNLEEIMRFLHSRQLLPTTVITIVSDHGEYFGEKNVYFRHSTDLGEPVLRIPFIIYQPTSGGGQIIDYPVQLVDVLPTILDLFNVAFIPENMAGFSLTPFLKNEHNVMDRYQFSEFHAQSGKNHFGIRLFPWKYVLTRQHDTSTTHLHRLTESSEMDDQTALYPEESKTLGAILDRWLQTTPQHQPHMDFEETDAGIANLQALGYIE